MNWAEAAVARQRDVTGGGADSRLAAYRFVTGALRRIRIRTKVNELRWMEAGAQRPVAREMREIEERCSTRV